MVMSDPRPSSKSAGKPWRRGIVLALLLMPGLCEVLVTTPGFDPGLLPAWIAVPIAMIGFLTFLVLAGLTSLVGNLVVAVLLGAFLRRRWRWPVWLALIAAAPCWLAFLRVLPKPW